MKKLMLWIVRFVYKVSGLKMLVDWVDLKITNYRLRLNIVPTSYKVFLVALGVVGSYGWNMAYSQYQTLTEAQKLTFEQPLKVEVAEAKQLTEAEKKALHVKNLADLIWERESTKGQHNFTKCEAQGKINSIGYNIPGNGNYVCFDSHEEEMAVLEGWIIGKQAQGMSDIQLLCLYSGNNYKECGLVR